MQRRTAQVLRIATIAVFVVVALLVVRLALESGDDSSRKPEIAEAEAGALTVSRALGEERSSAETVAVRGYLFDGGGTGVRLCYRRRPSNPPLCLGPFLDVYELDLRGLPFKRGEAVGRPIRWLDQPVTLYGHVVGTALTATGIAR